jgi:hypothetical protein
MKKVLCSISGVFAAVAMLVAMSACSSSDAERIVEEILPTTMARVIHLSPDAPEVDIDFELIEVQQSIVGLNYGEASAYTEISSGIAKVIVKDTNGQEVVTVDNPVFASDIDNTVYAVNLLANIEVIQSEDDRSTDPAKAKVRFVHASPDAPAVDVKTGSAAGAPVFANAAFKDISDYVLVDPGDYTFVVTQAGDNVNAVVTFAPATLEADKIYTVIAIGTLEDTDLFDFGVRVFDDTGSGNAFVDLTVAP